MSAPRRIAAMGLRVTENRSFGETLEWRSLPIVGAPQRHNRRAKTLRSLLIGLGLFWLGIIALILLA